MPCFTELSLIAFFFFFLNQIEDLGQPCSQQVCWNDFSNSIFSLGDSVLYFGNSCNSSNFFITIIFVMVICGQ